MDYGQMLAEYEKSLSPTSSRQYITHVKNFLAHAKGLEKEHLEDYLKQLQRDNCSEGYVNLIFRAIKRCYKVNALAWPLQSKEMPRVTEQEVFAPALAPSVIETMIKGARAGKLNPTETAYLALSTIYGMRVRELASVSPRDMDLQHLTLFVRTAKGGRQRYHQIPEAISEHLSVLRPTSTARLNRVFKRLEERLKLKHFEGVSWHSIRRALEQELVYSGLPSPVIRDFLRWRQVQGDMVGRYFRAQTVDQNGIVVGPGSHDSRVDEDVFKVHPFLKIWEG